MSNDATVFGGPTKRFFVSMLTRDIELDDAILDLLDNCVDGAIRQVGQANELGADAFAGYKARLTVNSKEFVLSDNCGGIPKEYLEDAFKLGRPSIEKDGDIATIGMYGIGMKRAIFKMAQSATVVSINPEISASVAYSKEWLEPGNDEDWTLPVSEVDPEGKEPGVTVICDDLKPEISRQFGFENFQNKLREKIAEHFGYIMQRGFEVELNGDPIKPITLPLFSADHSADAAIRPFDYVDKIGAVEVKVSIGFFRPLVKEQEVDEETEAPTGAEQAGLSVVCNDRVVLLHDRTMKTGWGDGGVPRFHPQFRAIAGLIVLRSADASQLPLSTTKRDLDVGSELFLKIRQVCIEGLKIFTSFTNKWKGMEKETEEFFEAVAKRDANKDIKLASEYGINIRGSEHGKKYKPSLPLPDPQKPKRRISFVKEVEEIDKVSDFLFGEPGQKPASVGSECFDRVLREAQDG